MDQNKTYVFSRARNTRIAFLIDDTIPIVQLKKILCENYTIWGGTHNPVIPVRGDEIAPEWIGLLENIDPDVIYHSSSVDPRKIQANGLRLYPRSFEVIPDNGILNLPGVNPLTFIDDFFRYNLSERRHVSLPYFQPGFAHILKDFLALNFGVRETYLEDDEYLQEIRKVVIYEDNISDALSQMYSQSGFMQNILCGFYMGNVIFRAERPHADKFELIIYDDENCFEDLIYFWNRQLYQASSKRLKQFAVSKNQFELLVNQDFFHWALDHSAEGGPIYVSSRSLDEQKLNSLFTDSKTGKFRVMFNIVPAENFPEPYFKIDQSISKHWVKTIFKGTEDFINMPEFPLGAQIHLKGEFEVDLRINDTGTWELSTFRFPHYTLLRRNISDIPGRVNKYNALSFHIESHMRGIDLRLPTISAIINSRVQIRDNAGEIERPAGLSQCVPSRAGLLLSAFMKLFNNDWAFVRDYVLDKFWLEIFTGSGKYQKIKPIWKLDQQLDSTNKSRGAEPNLHGKLEKGDGLFSFKDLQYELKCIYNLYHQELAAKGEDKDEKYIVPDMNAFILGRYQKDVKSILYAINCFVETEAIFIGLKVKCYNCGSKLWYSLKELSHQMSCRGCSFNIRPEPESAFYYKVNDTVLNNLMSDPVKRTKAYGGNYVVLEVLDYLREGRMGNPVTAFGYSPSQDIYLDHEDFKKTDLDILVLQDGKLIIGEAKLNPSEFDEMQIRQLIWIGNEIRPDIVLIAYKEGTLKPDVVEAVRNGITQPNVEILVIKIAEPIFRFGAMLGLAQEKKQTKKS